MLPSNFGTSIGRAHSYKTQFHSDMFWIHYTWIPTFCWSVGLFAFVTQLIHPFLLVRQSVLPILTRTGVPFVAVGEDLALPMSPAFHWMADVYHAFELWSTSWLLLSLRIRDTLHRNVTNPVRRTNVCASLDPLVREKSLIGNSQDNPNFAMGMYWPTDSNHLYPVDNKLSLTVTFTCL